MQLRRAFTAAATALSALAVIAATPERAVVIEDYAFKAPSVSVGPGTIVVWTNHDDDPHTVTADDGSFDSKGLGQGDVFRHVFATPGRYPYHCAAHPFMKGVVIVTEANRR